MILTAVEVQLLSRSFSLVIGGRQLFVPSGAPAEEKMSATNLVDLGLISVIHRGSRGDWYELTTLGEQHFAATWPNRKG